MNLRLTAPLLARRGEPRGQVLVLFALMLVVLLVVSALAVDYGGWLVTKRNYQNVTDSASLAGAQYLTRQPLVTVCPGAPSKNFCARQAAWESVKAALKFTALNPATQAAAASNLSYMEGGYRVWVASPPADANVACNTSNPLCFDSGRVYPGHVSGPGTVFVRVDHGAPSFLSGAIGQGRTVKAWATAGRFPANFAVIGMCSPTSITANCLAGDANIKLDGNGTNLIVGTGDLGTNRWTKVGGNNSGVALGSDSNAFMQLYDTCWGNATNQCQLWGYNNPNIDYSTTRAAVPLGAPIVDPLYPAPTVNATTTPNQCRGTGTVQLASVLESQTSPVDLDVDLAAAREPVGPGAVFAAAGFTISGKVTALAGGAGLGGMNIQILNGSNTVIGTDTTKSNPAASLGQYSVNNIPAGNYTIRVYDGTDFYLPTTLSVTVGPDASNKNLAMPTSPVVSGTVTSTAGGGGISGVTVTITAGGQNYTTTTNGSGAYSRSVPETGASSINGAKTGYNSNGPIAGPNLTAAGTFPNYNFTMTPAPGSVTGTITDAVTSLPVPGVIVTLSTGESATTNASGVYNIASTVQGAKTITLSGAAISPTSGYAYSTPASGGSLNVTGAMVQNYTVWPKGCYDGGSGGSFGSWACDWPSGNNCPATTNVDASNVTCTFTQANAIRPGTYKNITLPNNTCAWLDPRGGATGLAANQSAGIYHIKGTISMGNNSYLFGDGVTIVMDQGSGFDVNNGGGFVLNYGTHNTSGNSACPAATDYAVPYLYGETGNFCFRTVGAATLEDYNYAAWTSQGHFNWTNATFPTFSDDNVVKGQEMGVTFYMYGSGLGNASRMKLATANMGYLFNGVLYAPNDDIQLGGGKDGQSAAGQLVGWTIEYHGGTRILQNWYGDPVDGAPFLIEPILGE